MDSRSTFVFAIVSVILTVANGAAIADDLCQYLGDPDDEIADCTTAIASGRRVGQGLAMAYNNRAEAWIKKWQYDEALADIEEALQLQPKWSTALLNRGLAYQEKAKYELAKGDYDAVIAMEPTNATAYTLRGSLFGTRGEVDQAISDSTQAIAILSKVPGPRYYRGQSANLNPQIARALYNRGLGWKQKGQYKKALADFNQAIQANPADPHSWQKHPTSWEKMTDAEKAEELFSRIVFSPEMNTSDPRVYDVADVQKTRFGNVLLVRKNVLPPSALMFNGKIVYESPGMYVAIYGYFHSKDLDVILIGANPGGSATPESEMSFLLIKSANDSELLTDPQFVAETPLDGVSKQDKKGRIFVKLGFKAGNEMVAELNSGKLVIHAIAHKDQTLSDEDCQWLYEQGEADCTSDSAHQQGCREWASHLSLGVAGVEMGRFRSISNMPGFTQEGLSKACLAWCDGNPVPYQQFSRTACNMR